MASEVEECIKRITAHKGVQQIVVVNYEGIPIRTHPATMDHNEAVKACANLYPLFTQGAKMIKSLATALKNKDQESRRLSLSQKNAAQSHEEQAPENQDS